MGALVGFVATADTSALSFFAPFVFALAVLVFSVMFVLALPSIINRIVDQDLWTAMPLSNGQYVMAFGRDGLDRNPGPRLVAQVVARQQVPSCRKATRQRFGAHFMTR